MGTFAYFSGTGGSQTLSSGETGYVGRDALIFGSIDADTVTGVDVAIDGTVYINGDTPVSLSGTLITLTVGSTGLIRSVSHYDSGDPAVVIYLNNQESPAIGRLHNAGEIRGNALGLYAGTGHADDVLRCNNSGTILGERDGMFVVGPGRIFASNAGTIEGFRYGVSNDYFGLTDTPVSLTNTGLIHGGEAGIQVGGGADSVINRGRIEGEVRLGGGNDLFDGRGGLVEGSILLGNGDDTFIGNPLWGEAVDGGDGKDTVDLRFGAGAVIGLDDPNEYGGAAEGDTYTNVEVIVGSRSGGDEFRGNIQTNVLWGLGGNDVLDGGAGNDFLIGGKGADLLTGGTGSDAFQYLQLNEIGDTITDFSSFGVGNNDAFRISASAFGGGLGVGTLAANQFRVRADNLAQDADDRFIFRTTDKTLWFDVDGNGAAAAVMVADLQSGATMTNADIVMI